MTKLAKYAIFIQVLSFSMGHLYKVIALCLVLTPLSVQAETFRAFMLKGESIALYCVGCASFTAPSYLTRVRSPLPGLIPGDMVIKNRKMVSFTGEEPVKGGVYRSAIEREDLLQKLSEDGYLPLIFRQ